MLVDDTAFVRGALRNMLVESGFTIVAEASNGRDALNYYIQTKPDIITLDIIMPDMDGISTLKEIMRINKQAKVIMCTTLGHKHLVVEALREGAIDYIIKPYHKDRVINAVHRALGVETNLSIK